jgi:hypothetical protein
MDVLHMFDIQQNSFTLYILQLKNPDNVALRRAVPRPKFCFLPEKASTVKQAGLRVTFQKASKNI